MQQELQVAAQVDGSYRQAKGDDVLQEEEHRARAGCLTTYPHLTERTHRGGMRIAPVRRQHGEKRQQEQHSRGQQQVEAQVTLYGNVEPRVHQPPRHLYQQPGQEDDRRVQADILRIELEEDLSLAGSQYLLHAQFASSLQHHHRIEVHVVEQAYQQNQPRHQSEQSEHVRTALGYRVGISRYLSAQVEVLERDELVIDGLLPIA